MHAYCRTFSPEAGVVPLAGGPRRKAAKVRIMKVAKDQTAAEAAAIDRSSLLFPAMNTPGRASMPPRSPTGLAGPQGPQPPTNRRTSPSPERTTPQRQEITIRFMRTLPFHRNLRAGEVGTAFGGQTPSAGSNPNEADSARIEGVVRIGSPSLLRGLHGPYCISKPQAMSRLAYILEESLQESSPRGHIHREPGYAVINAGASSSRSTPWPDPIRVQLVGIGLVAAISSISSCPDTHPASWPPR